MSGNTFRGGIHPSENKRTTKDKNFSTLAIPHVCYIPLQQHAGKPAIPVVSTGDIVQEGQLIGRADGFISSNIHSSIPGKVIEIADYPTIYSKKTRCVVIEAKGEFTTSGKQLEKRKWDTSGKEELLDIIKNSGIVGLGGAAFPTPVKLSPPKDKKIDTLIINGAECEPYLTVDDMLMRTFPGEIIEGINIIMKVMDVNKAYIGIESNKPEAISVLKNIIKNNNIEIKTLKTKYPQGGEKQLIYSILKKEVPSGGLPMDAGVVVQNVGTIYAIRDAVVLGKTLFERYVTVAGKCINKPGNYKIKIGTRISDVAEECGGLNEQPAKIIMGGPLCGISIDSLDMPVVKGTSGILFLSRADVKVEKYNKCIRCGRCVSICPAGMLPCDISTAMERNRLDLIEKLNVFDCIMCGACSYICPSRRPLSHFIKQAQDKLRKKKSA